jgi:hypothetical protein
MSRTLKILLSILLVLAVIFSLAYLFTPSYVGVEEKDVSSSTPYFKTHFQDESQFIVEAIVQDLAGMSYFGKNKSAPDPKLFSVEAVETKPNFRKPQYSVTINLDKKLQKLTSPLDVRTAIWSSELYLEVLNTLFTSLDLHPTPTPITDPDVSILKDLSAFIAGDIERKNQKLSQALQTDFLNADLHENAAFLLGVFMLRENSGDFFDIRQPLCRMTAHLTFARALRKDHQLGQIGQLAESLSYALMNNQNDSMDKANALQANSPEIELWLRVLRTRNTSDYRILENISSPSTVEKVEYFRAMAESIHSVMAVKKFGLENFDTVPDWFRIISARNYSVQLGHVLLKAGLPLELQEISTVYKFSHKAPLEQKDLVKALNVSPRFCVSSENKESSVNVIDWGTWAMFLQRHLCHTVQQNFYFMNHKWGVHDQATEFSAECDKIFEGIRLYPFTQRFNSTEVNAYHKAVDKAFAVTVETPHLVSPEIWNNLCYKMDFAELYKPNPNPHVNEWHKHNPPPGTAYHPLPRMNHPSLTGRPNKEKILDELHEIAPYDMDISYNLLWIKYNKAVTLEQQEDVYKPLMDYRASPLAQIAYKQSHDAEIYERFMLKAASINPIHYYPLGDYMKDHQMDDKAAEYYQKGRIEFPDSVYAASVSGWMTEYYQKHGKLDEATKLADEAAEVYSFSGLETKAKLLEATEKYDEAFDYYRKIEDRYNASDPAIFFLTRYQKKTGDKKFESELKKRLQVLFPTGLEKIELTNLNNSPLDGVIIEEENQNVVSSGLKKGDIIVSLDQVRVHSLSQYLYLRESKDDPELSLIIWRQGKYFEIKAQPPGRKFGANFQTYTKK